ncbi:MAG: helix-turn-helix domain-containing protein [Phycisphaerae bacterium]
MEADFPFISSFRYMAVADYPPGSTFGPRHLQDFEFVWMVAGDAVYLRDGESFPAPEGSIVLCQPDTVDGFRWDPARRSRHFCFHFDLVRAPAGFAPARRWPVVRHADSTEVLPALFRHMSVLRLGADDVLLRTAGAHALMLFVTGTPVQAGSPAGAYPDPVRAALEALHDRLAVDPAAPLTPADLADAAAVSERHLARLMRRQTGHTPAETIRLARLDLAARLVTGTDLPMSQVASMCGFSQQFHFSEAFKRSYGTPPLRLRQQVRAGLTPPLPRLRRDVLEPQRQQVHSPS